MNKQSHRRKSSQGIQTHLVRAIAFLLQEEQVFPQKKKKKPAESPCRANNWKTAKTGLLKNNSGERWNFFALLQHCVF